MVKKPDFCWIEQLHFWSSLLGFILQVCVPRGSKDICLMVLSHASIMSHIIWLDTPWLVNAKSEHPHLLFFPNGMSLPVQLHPDMARACRPLFMLLSLCTHKKNLPNPQHLSTRTSNSKPFITGLLNVLYLYESIARGPTLLWWNYNIDCSKWNEISGKMTT